MQIKVIVPDDIYSTIREKAKEDLRTINQEIAFILRSYVLGTPTPVQSPAYYIATPNSNIDTTQMSGLEQQEYARKIMAEAKTKLTQEKQEAKEEAKQLTPEEEEMQKQKLELQKKRLQDQRDKAIRDKAIELGLDNAENYTERYLLFDRFAGDYLADRDFHNGEKYSNLSLETLYGYLNEIRVEEDKARAEETRRDELPHDIDDYDYKDEDFLADIEQLKEAYTEKYDSDFTDPDYLILENYYLRRRLYHKFEEYLRVMYIGEEAMQDMKNAFNNNDINLDYVNQVLLGHGESYRKAHGNRSYAQIVQDERDELLKIINESKNKQ